MDLGRKVVQADFDLTYSCLHYLSAVSTAFQLSGQPQVTHFLLNSLTESAASVISVLIFPFQNTCEYVEHQRTSTNIYGASAVSCLPLQGQLFIDSCLLFPIYRFAFILNSTYPIKLSQKSLVRYISESTLQIQMNDSQISFI